MFGSTATRTAFPILLLKKLCLIIIGAYLVIGLTAGYRAFYQMKSVDLEAPKMVRAGTSIETNVVTYGRTFVDVRLELIQGQQTEIVFTHRIPNNKWAFMDPRTMRVKMSTELTEEVLTKFQPGPATLRATATGLPQLGHVPSPIVRETIVEIRLD